MHDRHDTAATLTITSCGIWPLPAAAFETPRCQACMLGAGQLVLQAFEGGADVVTQGTEPRDGQIFVILWIVAHGPFSLFGMNKSNLRSGSGWKADLPLSFADHQGRCQCDI